MRPAKSLTHFGNARFRDLWNEQLVKSKGGASALQAEVKEIDRDIEQLMGRIVAAECDAYHSLRASHRCARRQTGRNAGNDSEFRPPAPKAAGPFPTNLDIKVSWRALGGSDNM